MPQIHQLKGGDKVAVAIKNGNIKKFPSTSLGITNRRCGKTNPFIMLIINNIPLKCTGSSINMVHMIANFLKFKTKR